MRRTGIILILLIGLSTFLCACSTGTGEGLEVIGTGIGEISNAEEYFAEAASKPDYSFLENAGEIKRSKTVKTALGKITLGDIEDYLYEACYDNYAPATIDQIKDVLEADSEFSNNNQISLTCTVYAHNQYCSQICNWTLTFEKLGDSWIGTECSKGVENVELLQGLDNETFAEIMTPRTPTYEVLEVLDIQTDKDAMTAIATYRIYELHAAYYTQEDVTKKFRFDTNRLSWVTGDSYESWTDPVGVVCVDISGHYEFSELRFSDTYSVSFDLDPTEDANKYIIKNYVEKFADNVTTMPYAEIEFEFCEEELLVHGDEMRTWVAVAENGFFLKISGDKLLYGSRQELKSNLHFDFYLEENCYVGTYPSY